MNEVRLIDANALIEKVNENKELFEKERVYLEDLLLNAPTVEPEVYMNGKDYNLYLEGYKQGKKHFERPQGEWIRTALYGKTCYECDSCHLHFDITTNFCPNCGANMRKGESE